MPAKRKTMTEAERKQRDKQRADKFVELANKRVNGAIRFIRNVRKLANTSTYVYTDAQAEAIVAALGNELTRLQRAFSERGAAKPQEFALPTE